MPRPKKSQLQQPINIEAAEAPKKPLVTTLIKVQGEINPLESLFDGKNAPEITSIGFTRLTEMPGSWVSYEIRSKGREILEIKVSEPDDKQIAEHTAKISFVTEFIDKAVF